MEINDNEFNWVETGKKKIYRSNQMETNGTKWKEKRK